MIVLFMGAPGAGKGTQAELLVKNCGFRTVSTGDALRKHVKDQTPLGKVAKEVMDRGELVSDDILLKILGEEIGHDPHEKLILDGYPRNLSQVHTLETVDFPHEVSYALHIDIDRKQLIARLSGRRVCVQCGATYHVTSHPPKEGQSCDKCGGEVVQRRDDTEESVAKRLEVFVSLTQPVIDYYASKGIYRQVSGDGDIMDIHARVQKALELSC